MTDKNYTPLEVSDDFLQLDTKGQTTLVALLTSKSISEAARNLKISRDTLYYRIDKYKLRIFLEKIPEQALDTLRMASSEAAEVFVRNLNKPLREMEAAREILDRVGVTGRKETMGVAFKDGDKEVKFVVTRS